PRSGAKTAAPPGRALWGRRKEGSAPSCAETAAPPGRALWGQFHRDEPGGDGRKMGWRTAGRSPRHPMHDRPTAAELLSAVRQFLETELLPTLSDARLRFQTLVAANVLAVAEREVEAEDQHLREEWEWLSGLLLLTQPGPDAT